MLDFIQWLLLVCAALSLIFTVAQKWVLIRQLATVASMLCVTLFSLVCAVLKRWRIKLRVLWYKWRPYKPLHAATGGNHPAPNVIMRRPGERVKVN